jgi:hypothetical protein
MAVLCRMRAAGVQYMFRVTSASTRNKFPLHLNLSSVAGVKQTINITIRRE